MPECGDIAQPGPALPLALDEQVCPVSQIEARCPQFRIKAGFDPLSICFY
jgi:hypothetical protein